MKRFAMLHCRASHLEADGSAVLHHSQTKYSLVVQEREVHRLTCCSADVGIRPIRLIAGVKLISAFLYIFPFLLPPSYSLET